MCYFHYLTHKMSSVNTLFKDISKNKFSVQKIDDV